MVIKVPGTKQSKGTLLTEATHYSKANRQELDEIAAKRELLMLNLFSPDWDRLAARPTGTIESLVAQSVGLVPDLAAADFIDEAKRFFYARNDSASISKLNTFLRRLADARENIAPLGELHPIEGKETRFKKSDFLAFAGRLGWELPEEFKRFVAVPEIDDPEPKTETTRKTIGKGTRRSQLHLLIWRVYQSLVSTTDKVTAQDVWQEIRFRFAEYDTDKIIQEVTADVIEWRSCYGNEPSLSRGTFDKTLSNLKKKPPF
ncbi:hypothetical protein A1359_14510 [Methylomonas lenta]|uniref:Uncharacterized protein n=1 Tax=Methylomonas lenta TaxID=980561 RepID=A0A177N080_9GAMM|nr:hypothetical protein [Methylomonas lenta]OAI11356.1 hypothetical protein A1359_14510 [Methylomonas lenta]